jgi:cellulose synthase/poly-beta-1,6-N-acetylglucosamine synthase-like glycosyltransferase/exo-beta-1,3-glucanase (GH17 family)
MDCRLAASRTLTPSCSGPDVANRIGWRAAFEQNVSAMNNEAANRIRHRGLLVTRRQRRAMSLVTFGVIVCLIAALHFAFWAVRNPHTSAPSVEQRLPSVSYNRFSSKNSEISEARIRADLTAIASQAKAVRTYSSTQGLELVPPIAAELGLTVTLGIWIDKDDARNEREIATALALAHRYPNVTRLVVGNETLFRHEQTAAGLAAFIRRVKRDSPVPVATADHWKFFLEHPELVDAVDQVFAHILPYWGGIPNALAVDDSIDVYDRLLAAYPNKKIVIGEFGWPSEGHNFERAKADPISQAVILRNFVVRANARAIDYNIVEAIDQPEKLFEGNVGPYWGIFDARLQPKFSWTGRIADPNYWKTALVAVMTGLLLSLAVLALPGTTIRQAALLSGIDHLGGHWCADLLMYWHTHYLLAGETISFAIALPLLLLLAPVLRSRVNEFAKVSFGRGPRRLLKLSPPIPAARSPKVSIHIPACREPPEMLLQTIDSVALLDYPNFECVVVINNTPDPAFWEPIKARCHELGPRFKFVYAENLVGFKAAALRLALAQTATDAEIIGVLDADYVVDRNWLKELTPAFADPNVGLVQAPQDHRDGSRSFIHSAMNAEYAGFFDIGMVERNEVNAIIVHGTMCLIRRTALDTAGGWSSDTICEDSDLGLSILEQGWRAQYTTRRYGWGLLPQDYLAFRTQRARWAAGAVQIVKKHWRQFLPGTSRLDRNQKREFIFGWLSWFGAEIIGVAAAILNLIWVPFVAFQVVAIPDTLLTLPILAAFLVSVGHFTSSYRLRVAISYQQMLGAMLVFMSVQWTVASAALKAALPAGQGYFHRTRKGGGTIVRRSPAMMPEAFLGMLLLAGSTLIYATNFYRYIETDLFAAVLLIQSLPFLAAVALVWLERIGNRKTGTSSAPPIGTGAEVI